MNIKYHSNNVDNVDVTISCKVENHGGKLRLVFDDFQWSYWEPTFCCHGEKLRWTCDECDEILNND